jgi:hypothetical protein
MHSHFESDQTFKFPEVFRNIAQFFAVGTALVDLVEENISVVCSLSTAWEPALLGDDRSPYERWREASVNLVGTQ